MSRTSIVLDVPLDSERYLAQLVLPRDLTRSEMLRLRRLLWTLVIPPRRLSPCAQDLSGQSSGAKGSA